MSRSSKTAPFSVSNIFSTWQGGQSGWVNSTIFGFIATIEMLPHAPAVRMFSQGSSSSISEVIFEVFSSMAETEQYFSFDSRTASSTDLRATLPPTTYVSLIDV